jgi:uncharacterized repeat protein (TIGR01451 family)
MRVYLTILLLCLSAAIRAQFTIIEPFKSGMQGTNLVIGGNAILTSGTIDAPGSGWLRLTGVSQNQTGYLYVNEAFPTNLGILIDFEYLAWKTNNNFTSNGADGICMILWDGSVPFGIGAFGGGLGYTPGDTTIPVPGVAGAYLGVGLDELGNFSNPSRFLNNAELLGGPGIRPDAIVIRDCADSSYYYVTGQQLPTNGSITNGDDGGIDHKGITAARPLPSAFYRRVQLEVTPEAGSYRVVARMQFAENGPFSTLLNYLSNTPPPPTLKIAFSASTGAFVNYHEIRNLSITTPGNLSILKEGLEATNVGDTIDYLVTVRNHSTNPVSGIGLVDTLPPYFVLTGYTLHNAGSNQVYNVDTNTSGIILADCDVLSAEEVSMTVTGYFSNATVIPARYRNTSYIVIPVGFTDDDPSNDTARVLTALPPSLLLPVRLMSFNGRASGTQNLLQWTVAEESEIQVYTLEYSDDAEHFKPIETIKATNLPDVHTYRYAHPTIARKSWYRLRIRDYDGSESFSHVIPLVNTANTVQLQAIPNPFTDVLQVQLSQAGTATAALMDVTGKTILERTLKNGETRLQGLKQLPAGTYLLRVTVEDGMVHTLSLQH